MVYLSNSIEKSVWIASLVACSTVEFIHENLIIVIFLHIFWQARMRWPLLSLCRPFSILKDVWIRTQRAAVASRCAINLSTHLPNRHLSPCYCYYITGGKGRKKRESLTLNNRRKDTISFFHFSLCNKILFKLFGMWLGQDQDYLGESREWLYRYLLLF